MRQKLLQENGFTLLELLISITLVAVIIVILSLALKTGMRAWIRGHDANRQIMALSAIQGLLEKQLLMSVRPGTGELAKFSRFVAEQDELVFTTTHAPMGAQAGGILLVIYRFIQGDSTLLYAQRIITDPKERKLLLRASVAPEDIPELREQGWEISLVPGLESVEFSYAMKDDDISIENIPEWPNAWYRNKQLPKAVGIVIEFKDENQENSRTLSTFFRIPDWKTVRQKTLFGK